MHADEYSEYFSHRVECVDKWERTKEQKKNTEHQNEYEIIIRKNEQVSRI